MPAIVYFVRLKALASTSRSFVNTLSEIGVFTGADFVSLVTIGASFTAATTMVKLPVVFPPKPSLTVYSITGTIPL